MIKILYIIIFLVIIFQINKFISGMHLTTSKNRKKGKVDPKSQMDIQDGEYEEVE